MYIKFNFRIPYVYCSMTNSQGTQKDIYLGSYASYKRIHPNLSYRSIVREQTINKWALHAPWKIITLDKVDADMIT